jgi:hypothetical protein
MMMLLIVKRMMSNEEIVAPSPFEKQSDGAKLGFSESINNSIYSSSSKSNLDSHRNNN